MTCELGKNKIHDNISLRTNQIMIMLFSTNQSPAFRTNFVTDRDLLIGSQLTRTRLNRIYQTGYEFFFFFVLSNVRGDKWKMDS